MNVNLRISLIVSSISLALSMTNAFATQTITMNEARAVVDAAEKAAMRDDIRKCATYHSDDFVMTGSFPKPDGSRSVIKKNKEQEIGESVEWLKHVTDHHYQSDAPTISIAENKAIARFHATESFTQDNKRIQSNSDQVDTLESRNGRVLITKADIQAIHLTVDGRRIY
jgi:hypothetical protein